MPIWLAIPCFLVGAALIVAAFWKQEEQYKWYNPDRLDYLGWGGALLAAATVIVITNLPS